MKESVIIIGGGVAGLEAASQLLALGLSPVIVERSDHLGGHVAEWYRLFPDLSAAQDLVGRLVDAASGARIYLETEISRINPLKDGYSATLNNGDILFCKAVLVCTGFHLFDASKKEEYGYGIYDRVITNRDLEHWFGGAEDSRIMDNPKAVGFVHCVGSRDIKAGNPQCSKVCCMTAVKQAIEVKEKFPEAEVYCFYMDLRLFGKKYEDFYISAQRDYGIHFIRGRVSEVSEDIEGRLLVKAEDTLNGKPLKVRLDLLVLMAGMVSHPQTARIASMVHAEVDDDGFLRSRDNIYSIVESGRRGIFFAGACTGTKTVPETVAEARAAALSAYRYIKEGK
ncbi:MAG: CoB--CoM heterodisulfide reductase iron-sulfur subunit A family protein [Bacteroidales bacterium]|nr:CoB--CoM heterodisulfide reductase iron-sulfur subunit A family protein [Bacteroidales bacterium]